MQKFKALPILAGAAALGVASFLAAPAHATLCTTAGTTTCSQLTISNDGGTVPLTGDFGAVGVAILGGGVAEITFYAGAELFGRAQMADVNTSLAVTNCTAITATTTCNVAAGQNVDGMGTFNVTVNGSGSTDYTNVVFDITGAGTGFTNDATVLAFNGGGGNCPAPGCDAAAHEIGFGTTFFVGEPVPAPIIGHGLLVVVAIGGVLFGGKLLEDLKKRHPHAA